MAIAAIILFFCSGIILSLTDAKSEPMNPCSIANIEALSSGESPTNLWCCGTTGVCVQGTNAVIIGKISNTPCK